MKDDKGNSLYTREKIRALNLSLSSPKEEARKEELENFRIDSAIKSLDILKTENVGIIADTGTGKTPISFIDILIHKTENENHRVLFLVPRRSLAYQHEKLFHKVEPDGSTQTAVFIGGIKLKDRKWYDKRKKIIFATPQMFMNDVRRGIADIEFFDDIVMDEFHHSQGNYDYVKIAELAEQYNKKIIGLSASPGNTEEKIEKLKKSSKISNFIRVEVKTPKKLEDVVFAEPDEALLTIEQHFFKLFSAVEKRLEQNNIFLARKREDLGQYLLDGKLSILEKTLHYETIREKELKMIGKSIDVMPQYEPKKWKALMWYAVYRKLKYAYAVCIMESYVTFLTYIEKIKKDETKASQKILASSVFQEIVSLAEKHRDEHPKILALIKNARYLYRLKMKTIIFVGEKVTGEYIKEIMNKKIPISEVVFGGQKNAKKQLETIEKLKDGELSFLVSTSVIEEGLHVQEVDAVVHYSMPMTERSRIQRNGRTARVKTGNVIFITLNHPLDKALYWATFRGEKNMAYILKKMESNKDHEKNISESEIVSNKESLLLENISDKVVTPDGKILINKSVSRRGTKRCTETMDMFQEKETLKLSVPISEEIESPSTSFDTAQDKTLGTNCNEQFEKHEEEPVKGIKKEKWSLFSIIRSFLKKLFRL